MVTEDIRGAVYIPSRAYHSWQMWNHYDEQEIERDFGYAHTVQLNALRLWLSYDFWRRHPDEHEKRFNHLLKAADARDIRIMPVLFEMCGINVMEDEFEADDPMTAVCVNAPHADVAANPDHWAGPAEFVQWFMERYASDERILAVEVINEPGVHVNAMNFAREMFRQAVYRRGARPLTVGSISMMHNLFFMDMGLDVLQYHDNFPESLDAFKRNLEDAVQTQKILNKPVWLTEWQRVRPGGSGWGDLPVMGDEWQPALATLAGQVRDAGIGSFFWSLMVKPAYLGAQREKGTLNGLFHEDGAVWSREDARAISGDPAFSAEERREWPEWRRVIKEQILDRR